jgi:hypothetical protein
VADSDLSIAGGFLDSTGAPTQVREGVAPGGAEAHVAAAIAAVAGHVRFDRDAIGQAIRRVLSDATLAGTALGLRQLGSPAPLGDLEEAAQSTEWDNWGTSLTDDWAPRGGPATVVNVDVVVDEVIESATSRMGHVLSEGIAAGHDDESLTAAMQAMVCDVLRSEVIARTEVTAALCMAVLSVYQRHGIDQWDWHAEEHPCPACRARAAANPHFVGSPLVFPEHPNCRCFPTPHAWA